MQKLIRTSLTLALLAACGTSETASDDEAPPVAKPDNTPAVPVAEPTDAIVDGNNEAANTPSGEGLEFDSKQAAMDQEARSASCETLTSSYTELRKTTNHCKQDSDCAEMPGNCTMGPYYINRYEDVVKLEITEAAYNSKLSLIHI